MFGKVAKRTDALVSIPCTQSCSDLAVGISGRGWWQRLSSGRYLGDGTWRLSRRQCLLESGAGCLLSSREGDELQRRLQCRTRRRRRRPSLAKMCLFLPIISASEKHRSRPQASRDGVKLPGLQLTFLRSETHHLRLHIIVLISKHAAPRLPAWSLQPRSQGPC